MKSEKGGFKGPAEVDFCSASKCGLDTLANLSGNANRFLEEWAQLEPNLPPLKKTILAQKGKIKDKDREVTIMFCGLKDQRELSREEECYVMFYVHHWEGLRGIVRPPTKGYGILAVFGAVDELEDATQRAVNASFALHKDPANFRKQMKINPQIPPLKIGIYTGTVKIITVEVYQVQLEEGDTINMAYQLEDVADPGTTYLGEETHRLTRGLFSFQRMTGCERGRFVGAGAGAATGAAIGAAAGKSARSVVIGGLLGALAGGVIGHYAYDKPKDEQTTKDFNFPSLPGNLIRVENGKKIHGKEQPISVYKVGKPQKDLSMYQSRKARMETGDLVQWKDYLSLHPYSWFWWVWRTITFSKINHSSMVLRLREYEELPTQRFTTESSLLSGTALNRLSHRLKHYNGEVYWYPLKDDLETCREKIGEEMLARIGIPYDLFRVFIITLCRCFGSPCKFLHVKKGSEILERWKMSHEEDKVFCSEYCFWVYKASVPIKKLPSQLVLPRDILGLKIFKEEEIEEGGMKRKEFWRQKIL